MSTAPIARRVDLAAFSVSFTGRLRAAGIGVSEGAAAEFARALALLRPASPSRLYWAARLTLVRRQGDLARFDEAFAAVFGGGVLAMDPDARRPNPASPPNPQGTVVPSRSGGVGAGLAGIGTSAAAPADTRTARDEDDRTGVVADRLPSRVVAAGGRPFGQFEEDELRALRAWLDAAAAGWPQRRTRRERPHQAGRRVALRETIARSRRTGWEAVRIVRTRPVPRPRRIVLVCDVSQSMQPFVDACLHLMRAAVLRGDAEVFAFSTRLTRLTAVLAHRAGGAAAAHATATVRDRLGGTHIAGSLRELLGSHHGNALRGAVVVIASDGWDSDTPEELGAAMARLHRRAYRVIWLNPRAGAPGYRPLVGALAAALPYVDEFGGFAAQSYR
ncbi:VWA domain-containing protein [Rhodococcus sp. NPDC127528]|uniref:vWA domain-containing protein n=1 Tax=unclassified Rhodococcus (in: high G+C Gram-positive bacteria) TaxID=192944 RepID=UPI00362EEDFF